MTITKFQEQLGPLQYYCVWQRTIDVVT